MNEPEAVGPASSLSSNAGFQPAVAHVPEDMTATVSADVTLADLQAALAKSRQWLPLDPPNPGRTLREILNRNESGPRRFGYGTIRDYVIGLKVRLADGRMVKSGGQVVKNVAGYDLQKLFIGSGGTLATPVEVTFKLRPLPETERCVEQRFATVDAAGAAIEAVIESALMPVVFDFYRETGTDLSLVLGFDGTKEDVDWQLARAAEMGFGESAAYDYDRTFRAQVKPVNKVSVLPSKLIETLRPLGDAPFVARAGNGINYHRVNGLDTGSQPTPISRQLHRRVKEAFDPGHLLPQRSA